jgi:hypothetical protein
MTKAEKRRWLCEVCDQPVRANPETGLMWVCESCERVGLCEECSQLGNHDCDGTDEETGEWGPFDGQTEE